MVKKKQKKEKKPPRAMRLLPITVTMLSLLFIIKANEVYIGSRQLQAMYGVRDAIAQDEKKPEEKAAAPADAKKEGEAKNEASDKSAKPEEKPAEDIKAADVKEPAKAEAKKEEAGHGGDAKAEAKKEEGGHGGGDKKPVEEPRTNGTGKSTIKEIEAMKARDAQPAFSKTEIDLLQNLAKRREELDTREKDLDMKSTVLDATEKRINDKITEIKTLEAELSKVLVQYNEKQDSQIKSLVKIYESMKPDEAAAIFNEMEMPILLDVIAKMSERKVAPVLANMNPKRARDVTQELAEKRKKVGQNPAAAGAGAAPRP